MGQMEPRRAQFIRSSTFEITNSAAFDTPAGGEADGGGGGAYGAGVGVDVDAFRDGSVVWRETTLWGETSWGKREEARLRRAIVMLCYEPRKTLSLPPTWGLYKNRKDSVCFVLQALNLTSKLHRPWRGTFLNRCLGSRIYIYILDNRVLEANFVGAGSKSGSRKIEQKSFWVG